MDVEEIIDQLYAVPVEEFTQKRNEAARELREAAEREHAERVRALRKPTGPAAAANHLVRAHRAEVEAFLQAAVALRDAQFAGSGDLVTAAQAERKALEKLISLGGESVRATLEAAAVDDNIARELLQARLVHQPEPAGFGTLLAHAQSAPNRSAKGTPAKEPESKPRRSQDAAARKRLQESKQTLAAAVANEREARRRWTKTQRELEKAQAAVEKAQQGLEHPSAH
jgi:hypothetical protein